MIHRQFFTASTFIVDRG